MNTPTLTEWHGKYPYKCPDRHRSLLDRLRIDAYRHRPDPETMTIRKIEWYEFPGTFVSHEAANCVDCGAPIVNAVGSVWGVRLYDDLKATMPAHKPRPKSN